MAFDYDMACNPINSLFIVMVAGNPSLSNTAFPVRRVDSSSSATTNLQRNGTNFVPRPSQPVLSLTNLLSQHVRTPLSLMEAGSSPLPTIGPTLDVEAFGHEAPPPFLISASRIPTPQASVTKTHTRSWNDTKRRRSSDTWTPALNLAANSPRLSSPSMV